MERSVGIFVGSLRAESINLALARALVRHAPEGLSFEWISIGDLPHYNADLEVDPPATVKALRKTVRALDALLVVTPEYNRSIPGVLKNAIDWASRPFAENSLARKPGGVIGSSPGPIGGAAAQQHLRNILTPLQVYLMGQPEAYIHFTPGAIDADGNVATDALQAILVRYMERYAEWIRRFERAGAD